MGNTNGQIRTYVAYDLETSGFMNGGGEMVEIGAVRFVDGEPDERFDELCALEGKMNPEASRVNHITDEMLAGCRPRAEVFADFCAFVGDLPIVGFNNHHFDDPFIEREAERTGLGSPVANGSHDVRVLLGGHGSLARWCEEFGLVNDEAHRAWADAEVTGRLFGRACDLVAPSNVEALCKRHAVTDRPEQMTLAVGGDGSRFKSYMDDCIHLHACRMLAWRYRDAGCKPVARKCTRECPCYQSARKILVPGLAGERAGVAFVIDNGKRCTSRWQDQLRVEGAE